MGTETGTGTEGQRDRGIGTGRNIVVIQLYRFIYMGQNGSFFTFNKSEKLGMFIWTHTNGTSGAQWVQFQVHNRYNFRCTIGTISGAQWVSFRCTMCTISGALQVWV